MFPTIELRWFHEGAAPPPGLLHRFQALGSAENQIPRVDYYLQLESEPALGVKLRDGRLEIKRRTAQHGVVQIRDRVTGELEGWRKWSFALVEPDVALDSGRKNISPWLPVRKTRQLLRFATAGDRRLLLHGQLRPERGCEIELTGVSLGTRLWWTLGLEAYGPEASLKDDLVAVAGRFFEGETAPVLEAADSYGYPEWLGRLSGSGGE